VALFSDEGIRWASARLPDSDSSRVIGYVNAENAKGTLVVSAAAEGILIWHRDRSR
jgi:hypothetical protein